MLPCSGIFTVAGSRFFEKLSSSLENLSEVWPSPPSRQESSVALFRPPEFVQEPTPKELSVLASCDPICLGIDFPRKSV